jgi:tetratricopeptide (TPR) repeat protein
MATYSKRGYKAPKEKEEKVNEFDTTVEDINVDEKDSTTAGIFNTLDETANKTEDWVIRNRKYIIGVVGVIALATLGYILYNKFVATPNQEQAFTDMNQAQVYFKQAVDATEKQDSLYNLALNGGEGKKGFIGIAEQYSGTKAGNFAHYYAGICYLNTKKFDKAITELDAFSAGDLYLKGLAIGAKGDAYSELKKYDDALKYYVEAANVDENEFVTPRFLMKAANVCIATNKKEEALGYLKTIKEKFENSNEGYTVDALIATLEK